MIKNHIGSKWHQTLSKKVILLAYISVILFQNIPIMENIYDSEIFGGNSEFFLEKHTKFQNESESSPHSSALSYPLDFSSDYVYFLANEKGYIDSDFYNLWFNGYYHDYSSMTYLSIDDETPIPLSDFTIIQSLLNLTKMANGIFRSDCIAESILQHPSLDVNLKIHIKLYSEQRFYTINYMVWSETIDFFDAELFVFNDLDMDGIDWYYDEIPDEYDDDDAFFDFSTQVIYAYDDDSDNIFGWTSPEDFDDWDVGTPSTLEARISGDSLGNTIQAFSQDIGLTTKQQKLSIEANQTWTVPIVFRFGRNELLYKSVGNVLKNEFVYDFSVLDFSVDLSDQPSVNATILNGGQYTQTRNISIYRNGTYLTSEERELTSGEYINIAFDNLDLIPGEYNEITVSVNNSANDFDNNDNCTQTHMFERTLEFNIKDLDGNVIEGLNVSLFNKETEEHLFSTTSNRNGNISFVDLLANNYTLQASIPEINNSIIYEMDFQYPDLGRYHNIQTNLTTLELQIQDVEGNPVENVSLEFKNNLSSEVIWRTTTNLDGNVTFQYLNGSYDITMAYFDYELQLSLGAIENFSLLEAQNYIQQVNLSTFKFEVINKGSGEPIESADVLIYINPTEHSSGTNIGKVKTDINGNVSIRWSSLVNYSIRIKLSGEFCQINISNSFYNAVNFTDSPYITYFYSEIGVFLGTLQQFAPELTRFNILPLSYTWNEMISLKFMLNITESNNPAHLGPRWANKTTITIRDSNDAIVYLGGADIISNQIGNHSFILNTSCGYFTSGNPETYFIKITAHLDSYLDPIPLSFYFNIKDITTSMESWTSSESLIWKDNLTISANFTATDGSPILDGTVSVNWGNYLDDVPMTNLNDGTYIIHINTSIGKPGNYKLEINAVSDHHFTQKATKNLLVDEVPTTVNGSILFDSRHSQYVTTENLTIQYNFIDSYRNISVPDTSPSYQLMCDETDQIYSGNLIYSEFGIYLFDPTTAHFPIGNYHGLIEFSATHHASSFASIQIEVFAIPSHINDSSIKQVPYELYCFESFTMNFNLTTSFDNSSINSANATFLIQEFNTGEIISGNLSEIQDGLYEFIPYTEAIPIGTYTTIITFEKANHTDASSNFVFEILEIPTRINDTGISSLPYDLYIGETLVFDFTFNDSYRNAAILDGNITYSIELEGSSEIFLGSLTESENGVYNFLPELESFEVGTYFTEILFTKQNYTSYTLDLAFIIHKIPLTADFKGSSSENTSILVPGSEYTITKGEEFTFDLRLFDIHNNSLDDCNISYILAKGDIKFEGTLEIDGNGVYSGNFSDFPEIGLYSLTLTIQKTNYTIEDIQIHLNIKYPTILGISQPYFIIGGLSLLIMSVGIFGYVAVRRARIPRFIKDLNYLEKILSNPSKVLPERFESREQQLKGIYSNRWIDFDLEFPIKPLQDELDAFLSLYNEATNKLLLVDDAKKFLDDLTIYSSEEIVTRLQTNNIPEENLPQLLEIIENYRKSMISEDFETRIISKVEEDEFDLDSLEPSSNENPGGNL